MGSRRTRGDRIKPEHLIKINVHKKDKEFEWRYDYFKKKSVCQWIT